MATEKWIAGSGVGLTWTDAASTAINIASTGLISGNAILCGVQIDNTTAMDMFCDVELTLPSLACIAPNYVGVYFFPLNSDATTYGYLISGAQAFSTTAAGPPQSQYCVGTIGLDAHTAAQQGTLRGIILPPAKGKFVLYNQTGAAWATSGNTFKYRTYNPSVA